MSTGILSSNFLSVGKTRELNDSNEKHVITLLLLWSRVFISDIQAGHLDKVFRTKSAILSKTLLYGRLLNNYSRGFLS